MQRHLGSGRVPAGTVGALLALALAVLPAQAAAAVIPPGSAAAQTGRTYGEWSAAWWQYAFGIPAPTNPLLDASGRKCRVAQSESVFFLVGTFTTTNVGQDVVGTAERTCRVPQGEPLFFPVLNAECSEAEGNGSTDAELRAGARSLANGATAMQVTVDGHGVPFYRAESPLFEFRMPAKNILGLPAGRTISVADGYYVLLAPLPRGEHTIHFEGRAPLGGGSSFILNVTYHLIVQ